MHAIGVLLEVVQKVQGAPGGVWKEGERGREKVRLGGGAQHTAYSREVGMRCSWVVVIGVVWLQGDGGGSCSPGLGSWVAVLAENNLEELGRREKGVGVGAGRRRGA